MDYCEICASQNKSVVAAVYCHVCKLFLCASHSQVHKNGAATSSHQLIPIEIEQQQTFQPQPQLQTLTTPMMQQPPSTPPSAPTTSKSIQQLSVECRDVVLPKLRSAVDEIREQSTLVHARAISTRTKIEQFTTASLDTVNTTNQEAMKQLEKIVSDKQSALMLQQNYLEELIQSLSTALKQMSSPSSAAIQQQQTQIQNQATQSAAILVDSKIKAIEKGEIILYPIEDEGLELEFVSGSPSSASANNNNNSFASSSSPSVPSTKIKVINTTPSASSSTAWGFGLSKARVGYRSNFVVCLFDKNGVARRIPPREICPVRVTIKQASSAVSTSASAATTTATVQATVYDNNNSTYFVSWVPQVAGLHTISVFLNGLAIKSSPFSVDVMSSSPTSPGLLKNPNIRHGQRHSILLCSNFLSSGAGGSKASSSSSDRINLEENETKKIAELGFLKTIISGLQGVVIYCATTKSRDAITKFMRTTGFTCQELSNDVNPVERERVMSKFYAGNGSCHVMVTADLSLIDSSRTMASATSSTAPLCMTLTILFDMPSFDVQQAMPKYFNRQDVAYIYVMAPISPAFEEREIQYLKQLEVRTGHTFEILTSNNLASYLN